MRTAPPGRRRAVASLAALVSGALTPTMFTITEATAATTVPEAPSFASDPYVATSAPRDGVVAPGRTGRIRGTAPVTVEVQWLRCPTIDDCVVIAGATDLERAPTAADVGAALRLRVRAANAVGSATALSPATSAVAPAPPTSRAAPTISGRLEPGSTVTASPGEWQGTAPLSYAYTWRRCTGDDCRPVGTDATYRLVPADLGTALEVTVAATNAARTSRATSARSAPVTGAPRFRHGPAVVDSVLRDGDVAAGRGGTVWGAAPTAITYAWLRCDAAGEACAPVPGAVALEHPLSSADVGHRLRLEARADAPGGVATARSAATPVVAPSRPAAVRAPAISGAATDGATLTLDPGSWSGTPAITWAYRWRRCTPERCRTLTGVTAARYTVTADDVGSTIDAVVVATNAAGARPGFAPATAVVAPRAPAVAGRPALFGSPRSGLALRVVGGAWTGTPPLARTYRWLRCDERGGACAPLPGETAAAYTLTDADVGRRVRAAVAVTNAGGSVAVTSTSSGVVAGRAAPLLTDRFDRPDGLITNSAAELAGPGQHGWSADWLATSGTWFARAGSAWSGIPDDRPPDHASVLATGSAILRIHTRRTDLASVAVSARLRVDALTSTARTPAHGWDGAHIWLRYHSPYELYAVSVARRDGTVVIRKKCRTATGGTYVDVGARATRAVPLGRWRAVQATVQNRSDGTVWLGAYVEGRLLAWGVDDGVGCPPLRAPGAVGVRGDNAELDVDDIEVRPI